MVKTVTDSKRGCGWRSPGGLYLMGPPGGFPCGRIPSPLDDCQKCGREWEQHRAYQWVDLDKCVVNRDCEHDSCGFCPLGGRKRERALLMWVGASNYTPHEFMAEALRLGVSKRIAAVPRGMVVGDTLVLLAHPHAIRRTCWICDGQGSYVSEQWEHNLPLFGEGVSETRQKKAHCIHCDGTGTVKSPGVLTAFVPSRVEYVVRETDTEKTLQPLEEKGIIPVRVVREEPVQCEIA